MGTVIFGFLLVGVGALVFYVLSLEEQKRDNVLSLLGILILVAIVILGLWAGFHGGTGSGDVDYPWDPRM